MAEKQSGNTTRRALMGGLVSTPLLVGGAVAGYEATSRRKTIESVNQQAVDRDGELTQTTLGKTDSGSTGDDDAFTYLSATSDLLNNVGRTVGEQVRVQRNDDEVAVYTIQGELSGDGPGVAGNALSRARLDLNNSNWEVNNSDQENLGDCRLACPRPEASVPINDDDEVDVDVNPMVVNPDLSVEEAQESDDYVEVSKQTDSDVIVLSPHGGDVQPHTGEQAETVVDELNGDVDHWGTRGYRNGSGAFVRWYVPSYNMSEASYPELAEVSENEYEYAIAFHGTCDPTIQIGGQAPQSFREEVRDAINDALEGTDLNAVLGTDDYRVDGDNTLVNRLAMRCAIWIGQDEESREQYGMEIAEAVAGVLESRV